MKTNGFRVILLLVLFPTFFLSSCVMDSKPLGYSVKNCTKDTLLIDLTESDTLSNDMYWNLHCRDTIDLISMDTTSVNVHGKKNVIFNYYCVAPGTKSRGFWPMNSDTFYIYTIKWSIVRTYTLENIRKKKLYARRRVTKKDLQKRLFEYRSRESIIVA